MTMLFYVVLLVSILSSAFAQPGKDRKGWFERLKSLKPKGAASKTSSGASNYPPPEGQGRVLPPEILSHGANVIVPPSQIPPHGSHAIVPPPPQIPPHGSHYIGPPPQIPLSPPKMPIAGAAAATDSEAIPDLSQAAKIMTDTINGIGHWEANNRLIGAGGIPPLPPLETHFK